jgi:hypothetical protein
MVENNIEVWNLQFIFREKRNNGAEFTVKSIRTGKEFTFKLGRSEFNGKWYTHVKVEKGYNNFVRLGTFSKGRIINQGLLVTTPAAEAIAWLLRQVENKEYVRIQQNVKVLHTGSCLVCGRKLTDSSSIETGIGPVCRDVL